MHWRDNAHLTIIVWATSSAADALATLQQPQRKGEQADDEGHDGGHRRADADVRDAQNAVAEGVDHVEDRVGQRHRLPEFRQHVDGIEDATQVGQRREHEGRNDRDVIELAREQRIDEATDGEQQRRQHHDHDGQEGVMDIEVREQEGHGGHDDADPQPAHGATDDVAEQDDPRGQRRDHQLLDAALELVGEE